MQPTFKKKKKEKSAEAFEVISSTCGVESKIQLPHFNAEIRENLETTLKKGVISHTWCVSWHTTNAETRERAKKKKKKVSF